MALLLHDHSEMDRVRVRSLTTGSLIDAERRAIRALLDEAFWSDDAEEGFADHDWEHALGGAHVVLEDDGRIVAHAAVVERELHVARRPVRTGYVEAVAVAPDAQARGLGTTVMRAVGDEIAERFELGALGTG